MRVQGPRFVFYFYHSTDDGNATTQKMFVCNQMMIFPYNISIYL